MARAATRSRKIEPPPWWLAGGEEECPHCGQLYAYELEVRCAECDGPMCPHCAVRSTSIYSCPDCRVAEGAVEESDI